MRTKEKLLCKQQSVLRVCKYYMYLFYAERSLPVLHFLVDSFLCKWAYLAENGGYHKYVAVLNSLSL